MTPPPPTKLRQATKTFVDNSGLLILGTVIALVWANLEHESYVRFAHRLHFIVNDIGMAFFFALAAKEVIEATAPGGALHAPRRAAMPLAAAVGGMLGPALIFVALTIVLDRPNLERGWAIPTATDIAFSYLAARIIFGAKHPAIPFLLLLAIADDALGLLDHRRVLSDRALAADRLRRVARRRHAARVVAAETATLSASGPTCSVAVCSRGWPSIAEGCTRRSRSCRSFRFLPHAARDPGLFVEAPHAHDTLNEFEHRFKRPVDVMLFFFGLANAGVVLGNVGAGTWFVLISILLGKPIGILAATAVSAAAGLRLPNDRHLAGYDRRRHRRRHRIYGGAVLRDGRVPVRSAARRNENGRAAQLRRVLRRPDRGPPSESGTVSVGG